MKIPVFIVIIILVVALLYVLAKKGARNSFTKEIPYGQFTVRVSAQGQKNLNLKYGIVDVLNVAYQISYGGQPIVFPAALQNNTGLPFLWAVYALPGAPDPTLVAGSQSMYLIYLKNGQPVLEPILEQGSDHATWQFLDGENGQPGPSTPVYMKNKLEGLEQLDTLAGGRYLLFGTQAVLDVAKRQIWRMNKNKSAIENYALSPEGGALAFSPDQKSIVFRAEFEFWNTAPENWPDSEHALVVYQFENDRAYAIKFDDTATRMNGDFATVHLHWLNTYFEWKPSPDGDRLQLRPLKELPNWTGRYTPSDHFYTLYPVKASLLPIFVDFILAEMNWTKKNISEVSSHDSTRRRIVVGTETTKLDIAFQEAERKLTLSKHDYTTSSSPEEAWIEQLAAAFNAELAKGKHQAHFGRIIHATRRIHGLEQPD